MPLQIVRENIVHMNTDAIVNSANSCLDALGGVSASVFDVAGFENMEKACREIGFCKPGKAVITSGFNLKAKYVIHTVGPNWQDGNSGEEDCLRSCYREALKIAKEYHFETIAFPLISSGKNGCPKAESLSVAVSEISKFLMENEILVYIVVYDKHSFLLSQKLFHSISSYIDDNYVYSREGYSPITRSFAPKNEKSSRFFARLSPLFKSKDGCIEAEESVCEACACQSIPMRNLEDVIGQLDESFSESLLRLIDEKGKSDVEIYKKANIDRKHFSKIRSNKDYKPTKPTVLAFAIALELSLDETKDLLSRAGLALSHSNKFDLVIEYFIKEKIYNVFEINEALFALDLPMLI